MEKIDLKSLLPEELSAFLESLGQPSYRGDQIFAWLHRGVETFDEMTDISKDLRTVLKEKSYISSPIVKKTLVSHIDSTVKYLYGLSDGENIETVQMRYHYGDSLCISTQAGCRMNCAFCASAVGGLKRNLTPSEMLDQIIFSQKNSGRKISHVVLMGIGEPLDNFDNVVQFLRVLSAPGGLNLSLRHVSLSTSGLVDKIRELQKLRLQLTLSVSLHAPNDAIRSEMMPVSRKWTIGPLLSACRDYAQATGRRISFEYAMISGVNDSDACASELAAKLKGMLCHVNLIPLNGARERRYTKSSRDRIERFSRILSRNGLSVTVRRTLGSDINASCGQLRREYGDDKGGSIDADYRSNGYRPRPEDQPG